MAAVVVANYGWKRYRMHSGSQDVQCKHMLYLQWIMHALDGLVYDENKI